MQMDNQLTPCQRYRLILSGPPVEILVLPIIMEAATQDSLELEPFYDEATRTFNFTVLCTDDADWEYDSYQLDRWIGIIRHHNTVFPNQAYNVRVYLECFSVVYESPTVPRRCVRRDLEWFLDYVARIRREELSIVVAPPHPEAPPDQFEKWAHWIEVYNAHAHEVELMEYSNMSAPIFV